MSEVPGSVPRKEQPDKPLQELWGETERGMSGMRKVNNGREHGKAPSHARSDKRGPNWDKGEEKGMYGMRDLNHGE